MKKLLLLALIMPVLAACGTAQPVNAPEAAETSAETEAAFDSTELEGITSIETSTEEESTAGEETSADSAEIGVPAGGSIARIVAFYNQQANAVKAAERITIKKHDVSDMSMEVPALMKAFMPSDAGSFDPSKDEMITETFVDGKGTKDTSRRLNNFMPVSGQPYVSQLKASHVQSASCAKQGEGWIVKINLKDEAMDMSGMDAMNEDMSEADREKMMSDYLSKSGYASCMEIGFGGPGGFSNDDNAQDRQPLGTFDPSSIKMEGGFQGGVIIAIFDKDGQLISLTLSYNMNMNTSFIGMKMNMNSVAKQAYQFAW